MGNVALAARLAARSSTAGCVRQATLQMGLEAHIRFGNYQKAYCGLIFLALITTETTWGSTLQFLLLKVSGKWGLAERHSGAYPMASSVGQILGSALFGRLADMIGRRPVVLISLSISVVGGACVVAIPTAPHATVFGLPCYAALMAALWLLGFGFGGSISPMGIMLAEILPVRGRGFALNCTTSAFQVGSVGVAVAAAYIMPDSTIELLGFSGWRLLYACEVVIAASFVLLMAAVLPESPRFLAVNGKRAALCRTLDRMAVHGGLAAPPHGNSGGGSDETDDPAASWRALGVEARAQAIEKIAESLEAEAKEGEATAAKEAATSGRGGLRMLFSPQLWQLTLLCSLMWSCWSFSCGFSAFLPILLKSKHLHKGGLYESLVINAVAGIPGKLLGGVLVEVLGRRRTISSALFVSGIGFFAFAFARNSWQLVASSSVINALNSLTVGAMFVYTAEAFPTAQRATGSAFVATMRSLVGLLGPVVAGFFAVSDAAIPLVCFAVASALGAVAAAMLPFETGGRVLQDHSTSSSSCPAATIAGATADSSIAAVPVPAVAGNLRSRLLQ